MEELTLDGELYLSTKRAAKVTGYAKDYVGQLCREGRITARLVGRNWYVLDSSIREHRFGISEQAPKNENSNEIESESTAESAISEWNSPNYVAEPVSELTIVGSEVEKTSDPVVFHESEEEHSDVSVSDSDEIETESAIETDTDTSSIVQEMQSAWQDWFKRKDEQMVVAETLNETLLESPEVMEERENFENSEEESSFYDANTYEEPEDSAEEAIEVEEEVSIPIHRTYVAPQERTEPPVAAYTPQEEEYVPERVRRSYRKQQRAVRQNGGFGSVWRTLFILVGLVAVVVGAIGTGFFDQYTQNVTPWSYPAQILAGQSIINNH